MEKPKIRWIEASPIVHEGEQMILLRDSEGIVDQSLIVSKPTAFLLSLMDGTRTMEEIQDDYQGALGGIIDLGKIQEVVAAMDSNLFLMNDNYLHHFQELKDEYENAPVRRSFLAGKSYPDDAGSLLAFLDDMLSPGASVKPEGEITGIIAPHIDYGRGKEVYRRVYAYLKGAEKPLILLFGTCHGYAEGMLHISTKDFATPLGIVPASAGLCDLIRSHPELRGHINEWPHRSEHSIELQLPILQFMKAGAPIEILPILTGSMHRYIMGERSLEEEEVAAPLHGLMDVLRRYGKPCLILSGADLAHIGAQFGDSTPLNRDALARSKERDNAILEHIKNVDAHGFFEEIKGEEDRRRICGLTSIYFQLKLLEGHRCDIVDYGQWSDGRSSVSFAGAVFYAP
jgi:MEMO1 family protein